MKRHIDEMDEASSSNERLEAENRLGDVISVSVPQFYPWCHGKSRGKVPNRLHVFYSSI